MLDEASDDPSGTIGTGSHAVEPTPAARPAPGTPSDLPDPEQLDIAADFTVFLRDGVDPLLRRAALRKLWTLDPVFAWQDGLVEYGEDFTDGAKAVPVVQTAFQAWDMLSELTNSVPNAIPESSRQTSEALVAERLGEMEPPRDQGCDQDTHAAESGAKKSRSAGMRQ
ncbi:hypothetical protein LMTR13_12785 [Bradyrhizobium icense]|uniref:DUF3306 domain-containing protein n=2 Tax=Bradyrhizobium icense TaxID=1274631 RepID=A0A1B1UDS6_9BRAD|nr:hypothetical protein LMTR13_12785 [Bradyrhizobium icense]